MPARNPFKTFRKGKGFGRSAFKTFGPKERARPRQPPSEFRREANEDDEYTRIRRLLDDDRQAQRVFRLAQQYPAGTVPELVVMDYLLVKRVQHIYQGKAFGGRRRRGGLVPDFIIPRNGKGLVIQVQGEYWHSIQRKGFADRTVKLKLMGRWVEGVKVEKVVEVWEDDLYHRKSDTTMRNALAGQEMR